MGLHAMKSRDGAKWAWTRTGALLLFLVTGILLVSSLTAARSHDGKLIGVPDASIGQTLNWKR